MAQFPTCALIAAVLVLSAADLRAGVIRVADIDMAGGVAPSPGLGAAHDKAGGKPLFALADAGASAAPSPALDAAPGLMQASPLASFDSVAPDQLLLADAAAAPRARGNAAANAGGKASPTPVPEAGTAALMAAALGAWLMLHAVIQRSRAARRARARGMAARTWSESRW